jgi:hypothetical protein
MQVDGGTTSWTALTDGVTGTSFAAPAMADLAALMTGACSNPGEQMLRATIRQAGIAGNPDGQYLYSTPGKGDFKDGAGFVSAADAYAYCGSTTGELDGGVVVKSGKVSQNLASGTTFRALGPDASVLFDARTPPPGGQALSNLHLESYTTPGLFDGRLYSEILNTKLVVGNRIRVSLTWDSCPAAMTGTAPAPLAVDFDLFLRNSTTGKWVYGSQSINDNNEGFDVTIPSAWGAGGYQVYVAWPSGAVGCYSSPTETFAWAASY